QPAAPAVLEKEGRKVEVTPLTGLSVQLGQRHLDLRMSGRRHAPAGAELGMQIVGEAPCDRQQPIVTGGAAKRDRRLDEMAGAVELVPVREVGPALARLRSEEHTSELQSRGHLV